MHESFEQLAQYGQTESFQHTTVHSAEKHLVNVCTMSSSQILICAVLCIESCRAETSIERQRILQTIVFHPEQISMSREDALEYLFQCVQNAGFSDRRVYASPANVDPGSFVALGRDSYRIRELSLRSGRREPVSQYKRSYCKILCCACFGRNGSLDLGDYKVCVPLILLVGRRA